MGFRDDGEALRERVDALETELEKSRAEAERLRAERDEARRGVEPHGEPGSRYRRGERVWVEWRGTWWKGTILGDRSSAGLHRVHYDGWSAAWDEDVPLSRLSPRSQPPPGARGGSSSVLRALLLAVVLAAIALAVQVGGRASFGAPEDAAPLSFADATPGRPVWIEWQGTWWPGSVVSVDGPAGVRVHYDDWSSEYDETVPAGRLRAR